MDIDPKYIRDPFWIDAQREWEEEQEELGEIDRSRYFYKFRSIDAAGYTLKSIAESCLWCSHFKSFNDLFEFRFDFDRHPAKTDEVYEIWKRDFPQYSNLARKMVPIYGIEIMKNLLDEFGISCFTKDPLNPLMWSYYADSYRGICLAFEFPDKGDGQITTDAMHEVTYAKEPLVFDVLLLKDRRQLLKNLIPFVTTKHEIWKHEAEWRYAGYQNASQSVPYRPDALKEIIFGPNTTSEQKGAVKAVCKSAGLAPRFMSVGLNAWSYTLNLSLRA